MNPQTTTFPPPMTLEQMPAVVNGFVVDLTTCNTHAQARALLAGLSHREKTIIYAACPTQLQAQLWRLQRGDAGQCRYPGSNGGSHA